MSAKSGGDESDGVSGTPLLSGAFFAGPANAASTTCQSLLNLSSSAYLTIITVQWQCSLTRSLVLPRKNRAIRECPCWPITTKFMRSFSA